MAAKRKNSKPNPTDFDGRDKPDFAADWFQSDRAQKKEKAKDKPSEDTARLSEALNNQVQLKLEQMKAALTKEAEEAEAKQAGKGPGRKPVTSKTLQRRADQKKFTEDEKENLSFAELFNPTDSEEESFEDLLDDNALDWRKFKDE